MYSAIANNSFSYLLTLDEFMKELPEEIRPSWIKITTITMVSSFIQDIDIKKLIPIVAGKTIRITITIDAAIDQKSSLLISLPSPSSPSLLSSQSSL